MYVVFIYELFAFYNAGRFEPDDDHITFDISFCFMDFINMFRTARNLLAVSKFYTFLLQIRSVLQFPIFRGSF